MKPQKIRDLQVDGAAYTLLLSTPDTELETKLPQTFLSTDYAGTQTAVNATLFLPTVTNLSTLALGAAGGTSVTVTGTNFYGSIGLASEVSLVQWQNQITKAFTTQTVTVASNTSITLTSVALTAGTYKLVVTTTKGIANSTQIAVAS
jgi:hypothetical protein